MKKLFNYLMMMAMTIVCVSSFTACGSDDGDDLIGGETGNLTVGTHRIDVDFEGITDGWKATVTYNGTSYPVTTGGSSLYENGEQLGTAQGSWFANGFRFYSVSTDDKCQSLLVMVVLRKEKGAVVQPMTVNLKSFVNGKMKKMKSVIVDGSHSAKNIVFYSEITDGDQKIDTDY